ncbi:MAG: carboxypeptidase regulatory-like domain-containing protein [Acidobacteriota bacterium]
MRISKVYRFRSRVLVAMCILVLVSLSEVSAQNRSMITGYVFGPGRSPVGEAAVELRNDFNSVIARTRTTASGQYSFFGVPNGRFTITVLPLGTNLEEQSQGVELAGIGARGQQVAENAQVDFYLRSRKAPEASDNEVVFAQDVVEPAKKAYEGAIADLESKRTDVGLAGLKRAIEIFPTYFLALRRLGSEQLLLESYGEASKSFRTALTVNQRCFVCWHGVSYASFATEKWNDAVESGEKALELEKNSVSTLAMVGIALRHLKRYEESEKYLLRAKKIDELKTPDIYWNLALLYSYNFKKYQEAADALELYLKANPSIPDPTSIRKIIKRLRENKPPSD